MSTEQKYPLISSLRCPSCNNTTLFLANGNLITCGWIECRNPDYEEALEALITKRETLARIDEHHESFNDFCRAFKTDDVWNEHTEYFNKRDSELKEGLDTNHE